MTGVGHRFDGALQRRIDYRYDVYGNLTEQALDGGAVIESLHYDSLHRLTQTSRSGASSGQVNYGYDAAGNFQYKSDFSTALTNAYAYSGGACGGGPNAVKSVQLKAGGSRSYCYDGAGNLISDNSGMSLRYDASQRPTVMHRGTADSQFRYGPDGDKARQWGSTGQRLYVGGIEDRPDTNETESYLGDYALIQTSPSGRKVQYLLRDRLGSVIGVADDAGAVEWRGFDAFGAPRSGNWADKSPNILGPNAQTAHGFTQHEHLDGLGLIHMNGRVSTRLSSSPATARASTRTATSSTTRWQGRIRRGMSSATSARFASARQGVAQMCKARKTMLPARWSPSNATASRRGRSLRVRRGRVGVMRAIRGRPMGAIMHHRGRDTLGKQLMRSSAYLRASSIITFSRLPR
ncbi:MAG: hypothetical protein CVV12_15225 [Gammaproteobacteria bacterium HGW-Gammaproteobacteria-2]|nr:MAG: hypothetical protein CVV12_15225 [Gammaproteobacteria bacterium HGW-Gammaproteobacteria-2]